MKSSIALCYTGQNIAPEKEPDGFLKVGSREIPFKRGNPDGFLPPVVPAEIAIELCSRPGEWDCVDPQDQADVEAAILEKTTKPKE